MRTNNNNRPLLVRLAQIRIRISEDQYMFKWIFISFSITKKFKIIIKIDIICWLNARRDLDRARTTKTRYRMKKLRNN